MSNYKDIIKSRIIRNIYKKNREIFDILQSIYDLNDTVQCYFVGGFVRDLLRTGEYNKDIDIEVFNTTKEELDELLGVQQVGNLAKVYILYINDYVLHISLADTDNLYEAMLQRDFTINAIYLECKTFETHCLPNAIDHLTDNVLHYTHPDIFQHDPIRLFRAARFINKFDLTPTQELITALRYSSELITRIIPNALENELYKTISESTNFYETLKIFEKLWIVNYIFPHEFVENKYSAINDSGEYIKRFEYINKLPCNEQEKLILSLVTLFYQTSTSEKIDKWFRYINPNFNSKIASPVKNLLKYSSLYLKPQYEYSFHVNQHKYYYRQAVLNLSDFEKNLFKLLIKVIYLAEIDDPFYAEYEEAMLIFERARFEAVVITGKDITKYVPESPEVGKIIACVNELYYLDILHNRNDALITFEVIFDKLLKS